MNNHTISLIKLKPNENAEVVSILGGKGASKRLFDLGLTYGTKIKTLRKALGRGPVEIEFRGTRLVIGYGLASKIQVKKLYESI